MLKIRLQRVGRKNDPSFRVVVTDSRRGPKSGNNVETVGSHNPKQHKTELKGERIKHWLSVGAQASGTVHNMLVSQNIIEGKKVNVLPRKSPVEKETLEEAEKNISQADEGKISQEEVQTPSQESAKGEKEEGQEETTQENSKKIQEEEKLEEEEVSQPAEGGAASDDVEKKGE